MLLTKLEIKGFKSFPDKVIINFGEGITGVVGPNGCGKSNVVDSIRWVLGEQKSRILRSEKMESVIFNGARKRKPTQMAEVSLTFDNTKKLLPTEYTSITITRKYYRSGESEYLLNGVTCRLKDVANLFMDTGITSNSYAIIELKMIDEILHDKGNSRIALFEEAVGVSKFMFRKKETLKKLTDTRVDLNRVEDLLFEINKNLKSLEKQAKQAGKYYRLKEEYKKLSVQMARISVRTQRNILQNMKKQSDEEQNNKVLLNRDLVNYEDKVQNMRSALSSKEKLLYSRQKALNGFVDKIRQYESDNNIKNERLHYLNDRNTQLSYQINSDEKSINQSALSIKSLSQKLEYVKKILSDKKFQLESLKDRYEEQKTKTGSLRKRTSFIAKEHKETQQNSIQATREWEIKKIQLSTLKQESERTITDTSKQTASLEEFNNKAKELVGKINFRKEKLAEIKSDEIKLASRIKTVNKMGEVIREELSNNERKRDKLENEYNLTKSMVDNLEGFPEAIKFLKKESLWNKNAPLLSDIITCDEKYRITIENYLGSFMNYYVVEKEKEAYQAVNILSDTGMGKAHFFILENLENYKPSGIQIFDNAIPATEIVEYDKRYHRLVVFILDNVYIVKGNERNIPKRDGIFITENGKIIKRKHGISGGSVGLFEGKRIGRVKNLEKLKIKIEEVKDKISHVETLLAQKQKELQELRRNSREKEIEIEQEEINTINEEYISIKTKQEQLKNFLSNQSDKHEVVENRVSETVNELARLHPKSAKIQESLQELEKKQSRVEEDLSISENLLADHSHTYNEQNIEFHQYQNKVLNLGKDMEYKENTLESSQTRIEKNISELEQINTEIKQLVGKAENTKNELVLMYEKKEVIEAGVNEIEKDYYATRGLIDEIEQKAKMIQQKRENADQILLELQNKLNDAKLSLTSTKERLSIEFNVNIDALYEENKKEKIQSLSHEELPALIKETKNKMEKIGPINPIAMEAYNEIKERNDFILTQKEDLIKATKSLQMTIGEIDTVAKDIFIKGFDKIKSNFKKVFCTLFTEDDDCDLHLSDIENPLESSIEIIAKPKGKNPLTINQLSGGEKALTAISLLFAIYLLKPAPFCIFDEVDAPLDDANVDKFNNTIRAFSKESQFIIVTHNKRTMSSTDVIYGMTMQEQGISKVVPVDLKGLA